MINVYGMESKAQALDVYRDSWRKKVPSVLQKDGALEQQWQAFTRLDGELEVKDTVSEPGILNTIQRCRT